MAPGHRAGGVGRDPEKIQKVGRRGNFKSKEVVNEALEHPAIRVPFNNVVQFT